MVKNTEPAAPAAGTTDIAVRRLRPGDEALGRDTINTLKPIEERHGHVVDIAFMRDFLAVKTNYLVVAHEGDTPLGYALGYSLPRVDRRQAMMYLHDVGVAENQRGKGIGSRMILEYP